MTFSELQKKAQPYTPLALLESTFSRSFRKTLYNACLCFFIIFLGARFFVHDKHIGTIFIALALFVLLKCIFLGLLEYMYRSYMYEKKNADSTFSLSPLCALAIIRTRQRDVTLSLWDIPEFHMAFSRLGIASKDSDFFITTRQIKLSVDEVNWTVGDTEYTFAQYVADCVRADKNFARFLFSVGASIDDMYVLIDLIETAQRQQGEQRWWMPEQLLRIPSLGRDWSYGHISFLEQYGTVVSDRTANSETLSQAYTTSGVPTFDRIESVLSRDRESNVVLLGETLETTDTMVRTFASRVARGDVPPALKYDRVVLIHPLPLIDNAKEKTALENLFSRFFDEAVRAENVILVFSSFSLFIENAHRLGADIVSVMEPYIRDGKVKVIVTSTTLDYHRSLETNVVFSTYFEKIEIPKNDTTALLRLLWWRALALERKRAVIFTYQALKHIVISAERFSNGSVEDKAFDMLSELASKKTTKGSLYIDGTAVSSFVQTITGIPQGTISPDESDTLLSLESHLHKRIIGQEEAITALAKSLRRARAGVTNTNRPIGSFLFVGPTGVGKTETAKALADIFFKGSNMMIRLDMSEYKTEDALGRLIGTTGSPGVLASWVREKSYGVLLLDEFEKTHKNVHDLFLQILDEGYFTDASGLKVNMRSMIIIATSNAGSDLIAGWVKNADSSLPSGGIADQLLSKKEALIETMIDRGIFKPELINRFDAVIMFRPLTPHELKVVAKTMLVKLSDRLKDKGIAIEITDDLIDYLVQHGNDPVFGARAMNRLIQDTIESKIADEIIRGRIQSGETLKLDVKTMEG